MSSIPLHSSLYIARSMRAAVRRPVGARARDWWSRAGEYLVRVGESATHHRMGSWTRR